mgnify:CR=1 FL=1
MICHNPLVISKSTAIISCYREITESRQCLSIKELAVNGRDLMEIGIPAGPGLGEFRLVLREHFPLFRRDYGFRQKAFPG